VIDQIHHNERASIRLISAQVPTPRFCFPTPLKASSKAQEVRHNCSYRLKGLSRRDRILKIISETFVRSSESLIASSIGIAQRPKSSRKFQLLQHNYSYHLQSLSRRDRILKIISETFVRSSESLIASSIGIAQRPKSSPNFQLLQHNYSYHLQSLSRRDTVLKIILETFAHSSKSLIAS